MWEIHKLIGIYKENYNNLIFICNNITKYMLISYDYFLFVCSIMSTSVLFSFASLLHRFSLHGNIIISL